MEHHKRINADIRHYIYIYVDLHFAFFFFQICDCAKLELTFDKQSKIKS